MKKLPLGIQTFKDIIEDEYLYIDKTKFIYNIANSGKYYFLSRPRRFGKSLTLSTLGSLFEGERELFKGLYIYDQPWDWKKWPILRFDFSIFSESFEPEVLENNIAESIQSYANHYNISLTKKEYDKRFQELLENLPDKAVILIDEYDKPILNYITDPVKAEKVKEILKGFYTAIKGSDAHVRFAFLTGVTKFAKISVFSGLNNLTDLTMESNYSDLCGYTEDELDYYFTDEFRIIAKEIKLSESELRGKIQEWYNGFRFSSKDIRVYNPISLLLFVRNHEFKPYWFETGTPTFLTQLMKNEGFSPEQMEELFCRDTDFSTYEVDNLAALPILFQSGYLTIRNYLPEEFIYVLGYPNREVKASFLENLIKAFAPKDRGMVNSPVIRLQESLKKYDLDAFFENLDILFAKVPYDIHLKYEKYWQSLFYMIFTLMGYYIEAEYKTSKGRIDAFINVDERVYLFEFKFTEKDDGIAKMAEAKKQIKETDYAKRFMDCGKPVSLLPVVFEYKDERAVIEWEEIK
ncbi:MAG: AAA family ATPase [Spirochaetes bacterium]|nr:MAG: AAA family ATPase [Spirochaetota bacterium]